jgi:hypothetical protein
VIVPKLVPVRLTKNDSVGSNVSSRFTWMVIVPLVCPAGMLSTPPATAV